MAEGDLTKAELQKLAAELDATGKVEVESESMTQDEIEAKAQAQESEPSPDKETSKEAEKQDEPETREEPEVEEKVPSSEISDERTKKADREEKDRDRLDRNWKKMQERQAELDRREQELKAHEQKAYKKPDLMQERGPQGYSVQEYQQAAAKWREEGETDLAQKAEEEARKLYFTGFQKAWAANMEDLIEEVPDLSDSRKPISIASTKVLEKLPFLRQLPDGCRYALRIAQGDVSNSLISELRAENKKLKSEVEKLAKSTRISGSGPSRMRTGEKPFMEMSREERKAQMRELSEMADRGE